MEGWWLEMKSVGKRRVVGRKWKVMVKSLISGQRYGGRK